MRTLYEGILGDINGTIANMDNTVKQVNFIKNLLNTTYPEKLAWHINEFKKLFNPKDRIKNVRLLKDGHYYIKFPDIDMHSSRFRAATAIELCKKGKDADTMITHYTSWEYTETNSKVLSSQGWDPDYSYIYELPKEYEFVFTMLEKELK